LFYLLNNPQFKEREHYHKRKRAYHKRKKACHGPSEEKMFYSLQIKCPSGEELLKNSKNKQPNTAKIIFLITIFVL